MGTPEENLRRDDASEAVRHGIADVDTGRTRSAEEVIADLSECYLPVDDNASR
jgi:predicted transcriptional regulator